VNSLLQSDDKVDNITLEDCD